MNYHKAILFAAILLVLGLTATHAQQTTNASGGEQEFSLHGFRWLIANDGLQIVQPDVYYFGGMIRSMKVALMARAFGKSYTTYVGGVGFLYMMHFTSALPNAMPHHEFKGFRTNIVCEFKTSPLQSVNGIVKVPTEHGSGVDIDPDFIGKFPLTPPSS